jgi:hypothetical protein
MSRDATSEIQRRIDTAESRAAVTRADLRRAVSDAVKASPEVAALAAEFNRVRARMSELAAAAALADRGLLPDSWPSAPMPRPVPSPASRSALAALETDAEAVLPGIGPA